ncbi:MAG: PDZ domain-containing protein [Actinomycetota bacterium]
MDRSEGNDDEAYPTAPVPAHERGWRHPSEIGQAAWADSEPPLTIGRGLSAATGAVGVVLAMAVLWAVIPTHAGRGVGVSAIATPATNVHDTTTSLQLVVTTPGHTTVPSPTTSTVSVTSLDTHHASAAMYQIEQATPRVPNAIAVAIDHGELVLTTANAVTRGDNVALMMGNGDTEFARVIMIDERDGVAVLSTREPVSSVAFRIAPTLSKGDVLTFFGDSGTTVVVGDDGTITPEWPLARMREGTPVFNQRGELVALCTHGKGGTRLAVLSRLTAVRAAIAAEAANRTVWLGITLGQQPDSLRIAAVDMAGPAAGAGISAGDAIVAIDGRPITNRTAFADDLHSHLPGDSISMTLRADDGTERTVQIVLASPNTQG